MTESISFDRAASFYDASRKLNEGIGDEITRALLAEIRESGADRVLEVGIGTGRMARPLMREGVQMVGVDISREMMGQLIAQLTPEHTPPDLLLGDATVLPFRDGSFKAAMVVHVLHLVASVEATVNEIRRVLVPGGVLLQQSRRADVATQKMWDEHDAFWDRICAAKGFTRRHRPDDAEIDQTLERLGGRLTYNYLSTEAYEASVEHELDNVRARKHSWTWGIPDGMLDEAMPEYEAWMREQSDRHGRFVDRVTYYVQACRW